LENWKSIFSEKDFWISIRNIFFFSLVFVPIQTILALVVASLLNLSIRGKVLFRVLYFLPVITPWVAGGLLWSWLYNSEFGLINWALGWIGLGPYQWNSSDNWLVTMGSIALANVWKGVGYSMVLLLAGMQNISKELLEAARLDGATGMDLFFKIIFPLVSPMIYLVLILSTISAFQAFDVFLILLDPVPINIPARNMVPNILIYKEAFVNTKMGTASAMAWALFVVILSITMLQKWQEKRWVHYAEE
jgi:multiple sugar transport system permease protein